MHPLNSSIHSHLKSCLKIFSLCCLVLFANCSKENETTAVSPEIPPVFETLDVSTATTRSVVLQGEITSLNSEKIIDAGFIFIRDYQLSTAKKELEISIGNQVNESEILSFTYEPEDLFAIGDTHAYYLYIKTERNFYKSALKIFAVDGLVVDQTEIITATVGERITLTGDFSMIDETYSLALTGSSQQTIPYTLGNENKSFSFSVPSNTKAVHGDLINVSLLKRKVNQADVTRNLGKVKLLATLFAPNKKKYLYNEIMNLTGSALPAAGTMDNTFQLLINGQPIAYQTTIEIGSLSNIHGNSFQLGYKNGRDSVSFPDPFTIDLPDLSALAFKSNLTHPNAYFTSLSFPFYDYFQDKGTYFLGEYPAEQRFGDGRNFNYFIGDLPEGNYTFKATNNGYSFEAAQQIKIEKFAWLPVSTEVKQVGDKIKIKGNFIDDFQYTFRLDGELYNTYYGTNGSIDLDIAPQFIGKKEIEIGYYSEQGIFYSGGKQVFETAAFVLEKISPLSGYPGEVITIEGKGVGFAYTVLFGNHVVYPTVINNNKIQVPAPDLPIKGQVRVSIPMNDNLYQYPDYFELL